MDLTTLYKISYGLYLVGASRDGRPNAQVVNTVFQVTAEPPAIAVSISKENLTHEYIRESRAFSVSILSRETPMTFIGRFGFRSGREMEKCTGIGYRIGMTGSPVILDHALGILEARLVAQLDVGTHTVFVGELVDAQSTGDGEPMTYAYYHQIKGGKSPRTAPTFMKPGP
jgi:ferric-chelate reductase [NAD(P)H]